MKKVILFLILFSGTLLSQVNIHATQDWVDSSFVKADYVFDADYELLSIEQQEEAIKEFGKLPAVREKGLLGILEELEKAHLYIIELNKLKEEINKLKKEIDKLK